MVDLIANEELLERLFPVYVITDREGVVVRVRSIFPDAHAHIVPGSQLMEHVTTAHPEILRPPLTLSAINGNLYLSIGIRGAVSKLFGYEIRDHILWISSILPEDKVSTGDFPPELRRYEQYYRLQDKLVALKSVKLSLQDAQELYDKVAEKNKELHAAQEKYRDVIESVNDIIFQTDVTGNWIFLNKAWEKAMGYTVEESMNVPFFQFLHPDDVQRNADLFGPLISRQKSYCSHQIRYIRKDGGIRWMKVYAVLIIDKDDQIQGTSGTLTDITAEVENFEKYRLLADNIHDIVCLHDMQGNFEYVAPSVTSLLGYTPEELEGQHPYHFIHPDDSDKVNEIYRGQLSTGKAYLVSYRFRSRSGQYHWLETSNKIIQEGGVSIKLISSSRIIDERVRAEENTMMALDERRRLNDQKARFISMASHEFRTPMASIQMSTDLIDMKIKSDPRYEDIRKHIEVINKEIDRFRLIMDNILTFGKAENDKIVLSKSHVNLLYLIAKCCERVRVALNEDRYIGISYLGTERLVQIDEPLMEHILENIISNAYKFSKGKAEPELTVVFHPDRFVLLLKDHGIGIPTADLPHLFSSFYRASNTSTIRGTGLGLVIVKNLVQRHGGKLEISSRQSEGSEVSILIPDVE